MHECFGLQFYNADKTMVSAQFKPIFLKLDFLAIKLKINVSNVVLIHGRCSG